MQKEDGRCSGVECGAPRLWNAWTDAVDLEARRNRDDGHDGVQSDARESLVDIKGTPIRNALRQPDRSHGTT